MSSDRNENLKKRIVVLDEEIERLTKIKELLSAALSGTVIQMLDNDGSWVVADDATLLYMHSPKYYRLKPQTLWMVATRSATHGKYDTREEADRALKASPRLLAEGFKIYKIEEDTHVS